MSNVLNKYYPIWIANCKESIRWLSSGQEFEDWYSQRGMIAPDIKIREELIKYYKAKIVLYEFEMNKQQ